MIPLEDRLEASCTKHGHTPCLCRLAAYRIRDLEAALERIIEYESGSDFHPIVRIARAALEERK